MAASSLPVLQELQRMEEMHGKSKIDSSKFQPNEKQQRELILHNAGARIVTLAIKRESTKYVFNQKRRFEEELRRGEAATGADHEGSHHEILTRLPTANSTIDGENDLNRIMYSRQKSYHRLRPSSSGHLDPNRNFIRALRSATSADDMINELIDQAHRESKNAKCMFELLSSSFDGGVLCQFNPKKTVEEVDLSHLSTNTINYASLTKLDNINQLKKKDGILLVLDPSINTDTRPVNLQVTYMKTIDLGVEEETTRTYTFWSNGNYFGLKLVKDIYRSYSESTIGSRNGSVKSSLPGWQGQAPIYIPAQKCTLQIVDLDQYSDSAAIANQLARLRVYCISCTNAKVGMKRAAEFLEHAVIKEVANSTMPGGIPALHFAAIHGNMEAIQQLVGNGANVNHRCRENKRFTPLHQAVVADHPEVVEFLLQHGASQIHKDDYGMVPLHYACRLGHITIVRMLMNHHEGKRALQQMDRDDHKPVEICANMFLKSCVELVMQKLRIYVKPRVSLYERV